jgi:pSer/pThr/pTyr-binding forkhead associated (FHA) protein
MPSTVRHTLLSKEGPERSTPYSLIEDEYLIGREPGNTIQIDSPGVSRRHARLYRRGEQYFVEDSGSSNGTFVNDRRLGEPHPLSDGDEIRLGQTVRIWRHISAILPTWCAGPVMA